MDKTARFAVRSAGFSALRRRDTDDSQRLPVARPADGTRRAVPARAGRTRGLAIPLRRRTTRPRPGRGGVDGRGAAGRERTRRLRGRHLRRRRLLAPPIPSELVRARPRRSARAATTDLRWWRSL